MFVLSILAGMLVVGYVVGRMRSHKSEPEMPNPFQNTRN